MQSVQFPDAKSFFLIKKITKLCETPSNRCECENTACKKKKLFVSEGPFQPVCPYRRIRRWKHQRPLQPAWNNDSWSFSSVSLRCLHANTTDQHYDTFKDSSIHAVRLSWWFSWRWRQSEQETLKTVLHLSCQHLRSDMKHFLKRQQLHLFKRLVVTHLASCFSASAHSSSSPMSTADTSMYGSHTVKPRPIRSMAVRRMVLWAGSLGLGGCSSRKVRALPAERNESEGFIRKQQEFEISLWGFSIRQY